MEITEWVDAVAGNLRSSTEIEISVQELDNSTQIITLQKGTINYHIVPTIEAELVVPEFDPNDLVLSLKMITWQLEKLSLVDVLAVKNNSRQLICLGYSSNFTPVSFPF